MVRPSPASSMLRYRRESQIPIYPLWRFPFRWRKVCGAYKSGGRARFNPRSASRVFRRVYRPRDHTAAVMFAAAALFEVLRGGKRRVVSNLRLTHARQRLTKHTTSGTGAERRTRMKYRLGQRVARDIGCGSALWASLMTSHYYTAM